MSQTPEGCRTPTQFIRAIPKVELHLHLEGAIPLHTLFHLTQKHKETSIKTIDDLRAKLTYTDFAHFIDIWIWKNSFIREEQDFEDITYRVLQNLSSQNVKYAEVFYSPGDFHQQGLSTQQITESILKGKKRAYNDFGIICQLIIDIVRGDGVDAGRQRLKEAVPYLGKGVVGIGLGGNEKKYPATPYAPVYKEAAREGFKRTAHAGEAAGAASIWECIKNLGVERIGHGVRAFEDSQLLTFLKKRQIPLEMCVVSNVKTRICTSVKAHPIKSYHEQGILVTINSDDPTMFNTSITREYMVLMQNLKFSLEDLKKLSMNGITASFMSEKAKNKMRSEFKKEWQQLLTNYL